MECDESFSRSRRTGDDGDVVLWVGHHGVVKFLFDIQWANEFVTEMFSETAVEITPFDLVVETKRVALYPRLIHL